MKNDLAEIIECIRKRDIAISEIELSARAYNVLKLNGIQYLSEFAAMSLDELKMLDLASSSVAEELFFCAKEYLYAIKKEIGYEKEKIEQPVSIHHADREPTKERCENLASLPAAAEKTEEACNVEYAAEKIAERNTSVVSEIVAEKKEALDDDRPIETLPLSTRAYNCLKRAKIDSVRQLSRMTTEDLLEIRALGPATVEELTHIIDMLLAGKGSLNAADGMNCVFLKSADTLLIQDLGLSMRTTACLHAARIRTVQALLDCFLKKIPIPNLNKESREEVIRAVQRYQEASEDRKNTKSDATAEVPHQDDRPIEVLSLSVRSFNCLKRSGIHTVQQLMAIPSADLLKIRSLGKTSASEIESVRRNYSPPPMPLPKTELSIEELKPLIMDAFVKPFKGLSFQEIKDALPDKAAENTIKRAIGALLSEQKIEYVDFRCYMRYPSFFEFLDANRSIFQNRELGIVKRRYSGETLEAIANDLGLTRERVRQIQVKTVRKLRERLSTIRGSSAFDEDFYKTLFTKCDLPDSFWSQELGLSHSSIYYLNNTYNRGSERPENILNDEDIPVSLRYRVRSFLDRKKINIDGMLFPPRRAEIENYALQKFAQDELAFDQFIELYNGLLETNKIPYDEKLYYAESNIRSRVNRYGNSMVCLWKAGERLRYYDIKSRDYTELLETLNLDSYQNTEISAKKLLDSYPALMEKYDIRDPYELHNLLKKIAAEYGLSNITFSRQPILQFGEFDRTQTIKDIMFALSPVTQQDLIEYLFLEFGYDRGTAVGYLTPLSEYCHNGTYDVDFIHIPDERTALLKNALTEDFYYIDRIREIYSFLFQNADPEDINPRSLKFMGFLVNSNYIVQNYPSAGAFFRSLLTRDDIYSIREHKKRYGSIQMFNQTLHELLREHQIFLFDEDQIITLKRLERLNVTEEVIEDYCTAVREFVEGDSYFTIESLRQAAFSHDLDTLGFDDFFYASLLKNDERFGWQRVFGTTVLYNGAASDSHSCADFILCQLREYESVDIDEFIRYIKVEYGVVIPDRYEVTAAIKGTELYYDSIMDKIYRDKSLYYADFDE